MRNYIVLLVAGIFAVFGCQNLSQSIKLDQSPFSLGEQIRKAREKKGISAESLAFMIDVSPYNIKTIEKGTATPTRELIFEIEKLLECELVMDGI